MGIIVTAALFTCVLSFTVADAVSGTTADVLNLLSVAALCVAVVAIVLDIGVMVFNRPRWAVPPLLRQEPGALDLWWQARRQRHRP